MSMAGSSFPLSMDRLLVDAMRRCILDVLVSTELKVS